MISVSLLKLPHGEGLPLPTYATAQSAGVDLMAAISEPFHIEPFERKLIPTGFSLALPQGYEAQIRPRSGLALKHGLSVLNSPGTIDSDFRGEVKIALINLGKKDFEIKTGERIAQIIVSKIEQLEIEEVQSLSQTDRGEGGFGSTGL